MGQPEGHDMESELAPQVARIALVVALLCGCGPTTSRDAGYALADGGSRDGEAQPSLAPTDAGLTGARLDVPNQATALPGADAGGPGGAAGTDGSAGGEPSGGSTIGASGGMSGVGGASGSIGAAGQSGGQAGDTASGGAGATGTGPGGSAGQPGQDAMAATSGGGSGGTTAPNMVATEPSLWVGIWEGQAKFTVAVTENPLTGMVERQERTVSTTLEIAEFVRDDEGEGWAAFTGRFGASECVVSAAIHAMVFFGDAISQVSFPIVSGSGGGLDRAGRMVGMTIAGDRRGDALEVKVAFESEGSRQPPCDNRELAFTLSRTR